MRQLTVFKTCLLGALTLILSGCAADRTQEQYRDELINRELNRIQNVSGSYGGELKSKSTGKTLGFISVEIQPDTQVKSSPDNTRGEATAIPRVKITYYSPNHPVETVFDSASLDKNTNTIKATKMVSMGGGGSSTPGSTMTPAASPSPSTSNGSPSASSATTLQMNLAALVTGTTLTGVLEVFNYAASGATFTLTKGFSNFPQAAADPNAPLNPAFSIQKSYAGKGTFTFLGTIPVGLDIRSYEAQTGDQELIQLVSPIKSVRAGLTLTSNFENVFENAVWDQSRGVLTGQYSESNLQINFECGTAAYDNSPSYWTCTYRNSAKPQAVQIHFTATQDPATPGDLPSFGKLYGRNSFQGPVQLPFSTDKQTIGLVLTERPGNPADDASSFLNYVKPIRATIVFSKRSQVVVDPAYWYYETHTLIGDSQVSVTKAETTGTQVVNFHFECREQGSGSNLTWKCFYQTNLHNDKIPFTLNPLKIEQQPNFPDPQFNVAQRYLTPPMPSGVAGTGPYPRELDLYTRPLSREDELAEFFAYQKILRAVLIVEPTNPISFSFENAVWYKDTGKLTGRMAYTSVGAGSTFELVLDCDQKADNIGWHCLYTSGLTGKVQDFDFNPIR